MKSEKEGRMISTDCVDSPSQEEVSSGEISGGGGPLKKGPWTSAEDAILVDYVNKHGEGNWNAVQKHSGLSRCGKSCRLRWANHLRPDLKKGSFTPEEEQLIIELHAKMGNKWARMAAELPGRTDNEIKNYWNTRIKRRQRAGLPIYPPDICQSLHEDQCQNMGPFPTGEMHHPDLLPSNSFEIPAVEFKNLELNHQVYSPTLFDIPASSLLSQGLGSSHGNRMFSMLHPRKRLWESECLLPAVNVGTTDGFPAFHQYHDGGCEKIAQSLGFPAACDIDLNANQQSSSFVLPGSHAFLNGNSSSSEPMPWAMKSELPSLQYSDTQIGSWETPSSPLPSLESVDTLIQSPPTEQTNSESLSRRNSGLLEAVLYESQTLKYSQNGSCPQMSSVSALAGDVVDAASHICETEWEAYSDPISPHGHSAASVFSKNTPISSTFFNDPHSADILPGCKEEREAVNGVMTNRKMKEEHANQIRFPRPDLLLASHWSGQSTERFMEHFILTDAIGAVFREDFSSDCKQTSAESAGSLGHRYGHGSCEWDNLSAACELSENH